MVDYLNVFNISNGEVPSPSEFMPIRGKYYNKDCFFQADIYQQISQSISNNQITFIIGNPLSGKTRIVYDNIVKFKNAYLIILQPGFETDEFTLPKNSDRILFIDDINDFSHKNSIALNRVINYSINNNIKLIITCRKGPEFEEFKKTINRHIYEELMMNCYEIPRWNKNEIVLKEFIKKYEHLSTTNDAFDGNIGSIILPLSAMKTRYNLLLKNNDDLPLSILKGLKLHYHLHNYEKNKNTYNNHKIRVFCEKFRDNKISFENWEKAKSKISSQITELNFIEDCEDIIIEEAYLDFIKNPITDQILDVVDPTMDLSKIKRLYRDLYRDPYEAKALGFVQNLRDYNSLILRSKSFNDALNIFSEFPQKINPNYQTANFLLGKCENIFQFFHAYNLFKKIKTINLWKVDISKFGSYFDNFCDLLTDTIELDKMQLIKKGAFANRLTKLSVQDKEKSLICLFSQLSPKEIFNNRNFSLVALYCLQSKNEFNIYFKNYLYILSSLRYKEQRNIIKACIKVEEYKLGKELINKHFKFDQFDYHNELGNCYSKSNYKTSYNHYFSALNKSEDLNQELKALINLNKLIVYHQREENREEILERSHRTLMKFSKINFQNTSLRFLKQAILINEIDKAEPTYLSNKLTDLLKKDYLGKSHLKNIRDDISNIRKKEIILDFIEKN